MFLLQKSGIAKIVISPPVNNLNAKDNFLHRSTIAAFLSLGRERSACKPLKPAVDFLKNLISWLDETSLPAVSEPQPRFVLFTALICLAEIALVLAAVPLVFETNDDVTMNSLAAGARTGNYSQYLIFSNIIIGKMLRWLYTETENINWYTWYLVSVFSAGYLALQLSFARVNGDVWAKAWRHLMIFGIAVFALFVLQFTRVSVMAVAGGLSLIFIGRRHYAGWAGGFLLIAVGSLVRYQVMLMFAILSLPFMVYYALKGRHVQWLIPMMAFALGFTLNQYNAAEYQKHEGFKAYTKFNVLRSKITTADTPHFNWEMQKELASEVGWTREDFMVAANFNLDPGPPKFQLPVIEKLSEHVNENWLSKTFSKVAVMEWVHVFRDFGGQFLEKPYYLFLLMIGLMIAGRKHRWLVIILLMLAYAMIVSWLLLMYGGGILKPWVLFGMTLPFFLFVLYIFQPEKLALPTVLRSKNPNKIFFYAVLAGVALAVALHLKVMPPAIKERIARDQAVYNFVASQKDELYVSWLQITHYPLFEMPYDVENAYGLGWFAGSPWNKEKMKRFSGDENNSIYNVFDKEITWYFRHFPGVYFRFDQPVKDFYRSNYPDVRITESEHVINETDTLIRCTFFIPKPEIEPTAFTIE